MKYFFKYFECKFDPLQNDRKLVISMGTVVENDNQSTQFNIIKCFKLRAKIS